jgi:hypothetical protein
VSWKRSYTKMPARGARRKARFWVSRKLLRKGGRDLRRLRKKRLRPSARKPRATGCTAPSEVRISREPLSLFKAAKTTPGRARRGSLTAWLTRPTPVAGEAATVI